MLFGDPNDVGWPKSTEHYGKEMSIGHWSILVQNNIFLHQNLNVARTWTSRNQNWLRWFCPSMFPSSANGSIIKTYQNYFIMNHASIKSRPVINLHLSWMSHNQITIIQNENTCELPKICMHFIHLDGHFSSQVFFKKSSKWVLHYPK